MNSQDRMALSAEAIDRGARIPNETIGYTGLALSYMRREITLDEFHEFNDEGAVTKYTNNMGKYVLPIPQVALDVNKALIQNQ